MPSKLIFQWFFNGKIIRSIYWTFRLPPCPSALLIAQGICRYALLSCLSVLVKRKYIFSFSSRNLTCWIWKNRGKKLEILDFQIICVSVSPSKCTFNCTFWSCIESVLGNPKSNKSKILIVEVNHSIFVSDYIRRLGKRLYRQSSVKDNEKL